jgi:hypothetical protein
MRVVDDSRTHNDARSCIHGSRTARRPAAADHLLLPIPLALPDASQIRRDVSDLSREELALSRNMRASMIRLCTCTSDAVGNSSPLATT